jgi:hypothetical protein
MSSAAQAEPVQQSIDRVKSPEMREATPFRHKKANRGPRLTTNVILNISERYENVLLKE